MSETITAAYYRGDKTFAVETKTADAPGPGEIAIKIAYCGICGTDMHVFHGNMDARVGHNRIVGHEMSGYVHALGAGVEGPAIGQKVVVRPLDPDLNLVDTSDLKGREPPDALVLHRDGRITFRGKDIDLQSYMDGREPGAVRIVPDRAASGPRLVEVTGDLRRLGATSVYVVTEKALE